MVDLTNAFERSERSCVKAVMNAIEQQKVPPPRTAAIFGASGGIGAALCSALIEQGISKIYAGAHSKNSPNGSEIVSFTFDLTDEGSIANAADAMRERPPELVIVATGVLTLGDGTGPERTYKRLDPAAMAEVLALNTVGPAMIAKHIMPLMPRDERFVFAALSARVGSISDNGLGGWHSYRASKAALNMLIKNFAIELRRTHPKGLIVGLHPGTVDTELSQPFQSNLPDSQLTDPSQAAENLLSVLARLTPDQSGRVFDFKGDEVPA